jgi:hypothetical protein
VTMRTVRHLAGMSHALGEYNAAEADFANALDTEADFLAVDNALIRALDLEERVERLVQHLRHVKNSLLSDEEPVS